MWAAADTPAPRRPQQSLCPIFPLIPFVRIKDGDLGVRLTWVQVHSCFRMRMFTPVLFTTVQKWELPTRAKVGDWLSEECHYPPCKYLMGILTDITL